MPQLLPSPSIIEAAGTKPKRIEEYAGRVNTRHESVSVARMVSPSGWQEPGRRPEFARRVRARPGRLATLP